MIAVRIIYRHVCPKVIWCMTMLLEVASIGTSWSSVGGFWLALNVCVCVCVRERDGSCKILVFNIILP